MMGIDPFAWLKKGIENRDYPSIGFWQYHASRLKFLLLLMLLAAFLIISYLIGNLTGTLQIQKLVHAEVQTQMTEQFQSVQQTLVNINVKLGELSDAQRDQAKDLKTIMLKPQYAPKN